MQENLYHAQQSTIKYHFSFRILSDRNMKMGCHAIFFLRRLILDITHSFQGISGDSPENLRKLPVYKKNLSPEKLDKNASILRCKRMETIIHFGKNSMAQPSFIIKKNDRLENRLRKVNYESSLVAKILKN